MLAVAAAAVIAATSPAPAPSAGEVLAHMTARNASLHSYTARLHFYIKLHSFITVPIRLNGTLYFKRPDRSLLLFDSVPKPAQAFKHFYATRGTPETWPREYGIDVLSGLSPDTLVLRLLPKQQGSLDHALITVDTHLWAEVHEDWLYHDGSSIHVDTTSAMVGRFLLPQHQEGDFDFPSYKAHVDADFFDYAPNVDIPDSTFKQ